ncbi:hypothetical protein ANN_18199 [Periplaneta americana]|uniref:Uncharacterized protein n=1 Tax=Periplaneta americana TaxID=6978 RepID=A0ABQ8SN35_PERAM|nr:hypothetical protein ANN_18199 [Periplaneta americana]
MRAYKLQLHQLKPDDCRKRANFSDEMIRRIDESSRFAVLASSDEVEEELDVNSVWENIRDNIKIAAEQSIGYYETNKRKPWFDEDCCMVVERRKQAKLKFLQEPVEANIDNYFNKRREANCTLRNKKRDDIIRNITSRRSRWAGNVARMGESRNAYRVLVRRPDGKRPLGRPRRSWEDNVKWI